MVGMHTRNKTLKKSDMDFEANFRENTGNGL